MSEKILTKQMAAPYGSLEVVLPIMGHSAQSLTQVIRSLKRQDYSIDRIVLVGQNPEDNLVSLGLHFSSKQVATVRVPPQARPFSRSWWTALAPHLTGTWVGIQLPFGKSHSDRFYEQVCYLTKHPKTPLCQTNTWIADNDGILTSRIFKPQNTHWEVSPRVPLFWSTHCFAQALLTDALFLSMADEICRGKTRTIDMPTFQIEHPLHTLNFANEVLNQFGPEAVPFSPFNKPRDPLTTPSIGVVIPAKNVEGFLPAALKSLGAQTYIPDEVMFIDDNSTDNTAAIAYASGAVTDIIKGPNRWASGARNKGIGHMSSEVIVLLDADDLLEPDWLARVLGMFARNPETGVMCGRYTYMDESGNRLYTSAPPVNQWSQKGLSQRNVLAGGAGFAFRRDAFLVSGGYDEKVRIGEDWDLWQRMVINYPLIFAQVPAYRIRSRRGSALRDGAFKEAEVWGLLRVEDVPQDKRQEAYQNILIDNAKRALAFGDATYAKEATRKAFALGGKPAQQVLPLLVASYLPQKLQTQAFKLRRQVRKTIGTWMDNNLPAPYGKKKKPRKL